MFDNKSEIGKVVNGVVMTPSENEKKKIISANPDKEILKATLGYMDMEVDEQPEYDQEKQYLEMAHEIVEEEIVVKKPILKIHYVVKDIIEDEITEDDIK